jgi:predicted lactoylglutathione lyase
MPDPAGLPDVPEMKLELVHVPVSDVDRARAFYERAGFGDLHDTQVTPERRVEDPDGNLWLLQQKTW